MSAPCEPCALTVQAADLVAEDSDSCKRGRQLESVASGDSHMSGEICCQIFIYVLSE